MGLMTAPPDVVALVLSKTDADTLVAVMQTSSAARRLVRALRDRIRLEHTVRGFLAGLPDVVSCHRSSVEEFNTGLWEASGAPVSRRHKIRGLGYLDLHTEDVHYMSIRVPAAGRFMALVTQGMHVLHLDEHLLRFFAGGDGTVEVMGFMRHLGWMRWHPIRIHHDTGPAEMVVHTVAAPSKRQRSLSVAVCWRIVQVPSVASCTFKHAAGCSLPLDSYSISFGHIVVIEGAAGPLVDVVALFTLMLDGSCYRLDGGAASSRDARSRCPVPLGPGCYYLPMAGKVDFSAVRLPKLEVAFRRPLDAVVRVYNVHTNYVKDVYGMCGVMFAP